MTRQIHGIVPPLVTPLLQRNTLDRRGLQHLVAEQLAAGVDGLFVLGTTGEGPSLSHQLRRQMIEATCDLVSGRVPVYVGITDTSLVDAQELAGFAADCGADAAVAAPPFYFPAGQTELRHWFTELAKDLALPLLLYNMPSCTRISIELESLMALLDLQNVVGLKDSSGDLNYLAAAIALVEKHRPGWPVMIGPEALLQQAMQLGAVGGVTGGANLCPQLFTGMLTAINSQDSVAVDQLQTIIDELQTLYTFGKYGSSYLKGLKCALELSGICSGLLAAPFDVFLPPERQRVSQWLQEFSGRRFICPASDHNPSDHNNQ